MTYKIINKLIEINVNDFFIIICNRTRGHALKLNMNYSRLNCRKYFFVNRVVAVWNSLPAEVITSSSLYMFKKRVFAHDVTNFCRGRAHTA